MKDKSDGFGVEKDDVAITTEWKAYSLDISAEEYSTVNGAFAWFVDNVKQTGTAPFTFYIDDIEWR
jgi:hypothetical protein